MLLSTFALQELTESARCADNAELLGSLPSLPIERDNNLEALYATRAESLQAPELIDAELLPVMRRLGLRRNLSAYDAIDVAMAVQFQVPLLTADARLARAPGRRCCVELIVPSGSSLPRLPLP